MTTLALPLRPTAPIASRRSATHKLALALVWVTVASGAVVFTEPAPFDVLTMGLVVLLPAIGLVAISPALTGLLALMLVAAAAAFLAATNAVEIGPAAIHTGVSLYLYVATFLFAAFVAKRPDAHARLILNAYTWAAVVAAVGGIVGYLRPGPGSARADDALGPRHRIVQGPQRVRAVPGAGARLRAEPAGRRAAPQGAAAARACC